MIGDSAVVVDTDGYITNKWKKFRGPECLWELLTHKRVNKEHVTSDDLRTYNKILLKNNAHLEGYERWRVFNVTWWKRSVKSSPLYLQSPKSVVSDRNFYARGNYIKTSTSKLYYNPARPPALSTLEKRAAAVSKKNQSDFWAWLEKQDAYTLHIPVKKRFLRNHTVMNVMDVWICGLVYVQFFAKHNEMHRYIDVFSKYMHLVPVKTNSGLSGASAFRSKFHDHDSRRRHVCERTYKGMNF